MCTGYSLLLHTQTSSYRVRPSAVLLDGRACGEYLGFYCFCLGESRQGLHVGEADSDDKRGGATSRLQDDGDIAEFPPPAESA